MANISKTNLRNSADATYQDVKKSKMRFFVKLKEKVIFIFGSFAFGLICRVEGNLFPLPGAR